jgi:CO/xanthine dehydrogenase Mo-binding subunit
MSAFAPYDIANLKLIGYDVVVNRPRASAYRAPGAPMSVFAAESLLDMLAQKLEMDPLQLRLLNAVSDGSQTAYGATIKHSGLCATLEAAAQHPHYSAPLGPNQGRGVATGFWFNAGGVSSVLAELDKEGCILIKIGNPDIGGSRASMAMMAADAFGVDYSRIRVDIVDTHSIASSEMTNGSRVTFATGMAVIEAVAELREKLRQAAAQFWQVSSEEVSLESGMMRLRGSDQVLTLAELVEYAQPDQKIARVSLTAQGPLPAFGTHLCDVEVDPETGAVSVLRYTVIQDVGKAIHPSYVEGQLQGGAVQGIGWALNEACLYDENGRIQNPGFLDYRIPVASDLPMIDTVLVEVPNPLHPLGVKGVGEAPIVPALAAVANAVARAAGTRLFALPMSPPAVQKAIKRAARRRR